MKKDQIKLDTPHAKAFNKMMPVFKAEDTDDATVMTIYDEIGIWGVSAESFRSELKNAKDRIILNINSPGGDVFDGIAIYNDLVQHAATVEVNITGLAASAASIIAMAGDVIRMADNSFLMIHNAWGMTIGNKHDMRETADIMDGIDKALSKTYSKQTGISQDEISNMMDAETWLNADDAVEQGFADSITNEGDLSALFDLSAYNHVPNEVKRNIESGLREAGYSRREATAAVNNGFQVLPRDAVRPCRSQCDTDNEELTAATNLLNTLNAA